MSRRSAARAALFLSGVLGSLVPATAQSRDEIHFAPGTDHATVEGRITGHAYADHVLVARAGQTMSVSLQVKGTDGDGTIYFNILPPGSDGIAIFNGSTSTDGRGTVRLSETGPYAVRVYLMGNDEDAGKTVRYAVTATVR